MLSLVLSFFQVDQWWLSLKDDEQWSDEVKQNLVDQLQIATLCDDSGCTDDACTFVSNELISWCVCYFMPSPVTGHQRHSVYGLSMCPFVRDRIIKSFWTEYISNCSWECHQISNLHAVVNKGELINFDVVGQDPIKTTHEAFAHSSISGMCRRILMKLITITQYQIQMMTYTLLLVHLHGPLWKSLIALFGMLHLVYGTNSPLIFASLVRYSLLHFYLSHIAVHHLHHLHYHRLHLLLLAQSFILNLRLGSSANPFLRRLFLFLPDWFHGLSDYSTFLFCSTAGFVYMVC